MEREEGSEMERQKPLEAIGKTDVGVSVDWNAPYQVGAVYFLRTITMYYIGKLVEVYPQELVFEQVVWVADTGRFHDAMTKGTLSEVEPYGAGRVIIGRGAIVDASIWTHQIPTTPQ